MLIFSLNYTFNNAESRYQNSRSGIEEKQQLEYQSFIRQKNELTYFGTN